MQSSRRSIYCCVLVLMSTYVVEFDDTYAKLTELDREYTFLIIELIAQFVEGLGPAYNAWNQTFKITHNTSIGTTELAVVRDLARKEEQTLLKICNQVTLMAAKQTVR